MSESLHLMPGHGTHHLAATLLMLLRAAQAGQINGLIFAASLKGSETFYCDSCGKLFRDPVKALGATLLLQQELQGLICRRETDSVF